MYLTDEQLCAALEEALSLPPRSKRYKAVRHTLQRLGRWKQKARGIPMHHGHDERRNK